MMKSNQLYGVETWRITEKNKKRLDGINGYSKKIFGSMTITEDQKQRDTKTNSSGGNAVWRYRSKTTDPIWTLATIMFGNK